MRRWPTTARSARTSTTSSWRSLSSGSPSSRDDVVYLVPNAVVYFESSWTGREPAEIVEALMKGDPPVYCKEILGGGRGLAFYSFNPTHEEMQIAAGRVREELLV